MYNRPKLLTIKIKHMKRIFVFTLLLLLSSCAVSEGIAYDSAPICRYSVDCEISGIHDHVFFD